MDTFNVERNDDCIWVTDLREPPDAAVKHLVPEQATELVDKLLTALDPKPDPPDRIGGTEDDEPGGRVEA